jgi:predicted O-methyltransferase YrrM
VSDRLPDNLATLYDAFGREAIDTILPGDAFTVDDVEFVCQYLPGSTSERFYVVKSLALVDRYRDLARRFTGGTIVELGIAEGGSTALLALLAKPLKLIAADLEPEPVAALAEFISHRGLGDQVRPHYGIDQSDRHRLGSIVDQELEGSTIDVVVDDCSHRYEPTLASFETLFPRLRRGGLYIIEDWNADQLMRDAFKAALAAASPADRAVAIEQMRGSVTATDGSHARREPLVRLAHELVLARSCAGDAIAGVSVGEFWIVVERGGADLDSSAFRLRDQYTDHFGFLSRGP